MTNYDRPLCSASLIVARRVPATHASRYGDHYVYCEPHAGPGDAPLPTTAPEPEAAPVPQPVVPVSGVLVNCPRCGAQRAVNTPCIGCPGWTPRIRQGHTAP